MINIEQNIQQVRQRINQTELASGRQLDSVLLLAVSKQKSIADIHEAFRCGVTHFGENYLQEAQAKIKSLAHLPLCWHFIGPLQSNKAKSIASLFHWVHSINQLKIAQLLNQYRGNLSSPLQVCLQIKLVPEKNKTGIIINEAAELAYLVSQLPNLRLRGLMTIPPPMSNAEQQFQLFAELKQLLLNLNQQLNLTMDTLSMGMSDDLIPAIRAGATIVRIGRAIFGEREYTLHT